MPRIIGDSAGFHIYPFPNGSPYKEKRITPDIPAPIPEYGIGLNSQTIKTSRDPFLPNQIIKEWLIFLTALIFIKS